MTSVQLPADFLPRISIFWLKKHGFLDNPKSGYYVQNDYKIEIISVVQDYHPYLYLIYIDNDGVASRSQKINLTRTLCHYGGWRYWFQCPRPRNGMICGKRIGVLHAYKGIFGCRECLGMTYSCRQRNTKSPLQEYARAIKAMRKLHALEFSRKRLRYNGKPTKYSRQLKKLHKELFGDNKIDI